MDMIQRLINNHDLCPKCEAELECIRTDIGRAYNAYTHRWICVTYEVVLCNNCGTYSEILLEDIT